MKKFKLRKERIGKLREEITKNLQGVYKELTIDLSVHSELNRLGNKDDNTKGQE